MRTFKTIHASCAGNNVFLSESPLANDHPSNAKELCELITTVTLLEFERLTGACATKSKVHITVETDE